MCCTLSPAKLSKTILYAGEHLAPAGRAVHIMGYQNTVQNMLTGVSDDWDWRRP